MSIALYNAKVYVEEGCFAEAVLVEGSRIVMVGSSEAVLSALRKKHGSLPAEKIDCKGKTILPGFNDSHTHFIFSGKQMTEAQIIGSTSINDLIHRCITFLRGNPKAAEKGLHAFGWDQELFVQDEKRMPCRHDLDRISTEVPIVLERICAHIVVANTKAIELLGLDEHSPQYEGGLFEKEETGFPSGIFCEKACEPLLAVLPPATVEDQRNHFKAAMEHAVSVGLTSVQSCDIGVIGDDHIKILQMMDDVYACGEGLLRYRHQVYCTSLSQFMTRIRDGIFHREENRNDMHVVGSLKILKDGSLGGRTALMRQDYLDEPGTRGVEILNREEVLSFCRIARENHIQTLIHAIGDGAIESVLDSLEDTMPQGNPDRNTIVHCQITDYPLLKRIADDRVLIQYQPIFLNSDLHILEPRVGKALATSSYAFRTAMEMPKMSSLVSFGTDAPVESSNPFENIYCAVTRKDLSGWPKTGYVPGERVSVSRAIDTYTAGSAYAEFQEHQKGRIKPGYLADMILLDQDIFTFPVQEIKNIRPVLTMMDGRIVYHKIFT